MNPESKRPGRPSRPPTPVDPERIEASADSDAELVDRLKSIRDNLTARLVTAPDYAAAQLAKVLTETLVQIEDLEQPDRPKPETPLDEFSRRLLAKMEGK